MRNRDVRRPWRLVLSSLLLAALAVLVPIAPAQAHDRLVSSDPESGAALEEAPEEIGLTFSANVQDIGGSVDLTDGDGETVEVGSPETEGTTVTTAIEDDLPAGDYEVRWRVVSSDGHAISGVVDFTVEGDEASSESSDTEGSGSSSSASEFSQAPTSSEAATSSDASPETSDEAAGDESAETSGEESTTSPAMLLLAAGVIVVVLGAGAALLRSRRRSDD